MRITVPYSIGAVCIDCGCRVTDDQYEYCKDCPCGCACKNFYKEDSMTNNQQIQRIVSDYMDCMICTDHGKKLCEMHAADEQTEIERQAKLSAMDFYGHGFTCE